ncbi:MAG: SMC-Scp complex subunit ScpB [Candidatus Lokiarchaeota archaeon]|nr:SMC-Scp complex subunit ScpB [Candidatus Lokiarchaeota archaeon]
MNNSNENLKEDSKENLKDEFKDHPEGLLDKENGENNAMEIQVDSKEKLEDEFKDQTEVLPDKKNESNEVMEIQDVTKEINNEKPEVENLDLINETIVENLESEVDEKEIFEKQLRDFHRNLIEASLYAAGRTLTIEEISNKLELPKKEVEELINEVAFEYLERSAALFIAQIGEGYQMQIRPEYTEKVSKFAKGGAIAEKYLRTLTIIALKQPILKSTVIKLRGTGAYEHVKYLLDNSFIDAVKKGRSREITTTDKYADMFGLPKDKTELKRAMVNQLGISEDGNPIQSSEDEEK